MATYLTGRTRTLTITGEFVGRIYYGVRTSSSPHPTGALNEAFLDVRVPGVGQFQVSGDHSVFDPPLAQDYWTPNWLVHVDANPDPDSPTSDSAVVEGRIELTGDPFYSWPDPGERAIDGSFSMTCTTQECVEFTVPEDVDEHGFPNHGQGDSIVGDPK